MAQAFQNNGKRPFVFEAQNFRRNFGNDFDTVIVSGFSRYVRPKQIVDFFALKEGHCVCVSTKSNPPSVLLRFSSPVVAQKVLLRYNNADIYGQKLTILPNNWRSTVPGMTLQSAMVPPLIGNNACISTPNILPRQVQLPSSLSDVQPMVGASILNLAKALLIQTNNLNSSAFIQRKNQTHSPQRKFSPSRCSPPSNEQRNMDRRSPSRANDNRSGSGQKNADKGSPTPGNRRDKHTMAKNQETAQKNQSDKKNEEIKGPVIRRKRLRRRKKDIVNGRNSERTRTAAVPKTSSGITSSIGKSMDKSDETSLQKTSQDTRKENNCSANNNKNDELGTKTTIHCKNNAEENEKTKPKENEASADSLQSKNTTERERPTSQGIGGKKECLRRVGDTKGKREGDSKTIQKDSVLENEKPADGSKNNNGESQEVTQNISSKNESPTRKSDKDRQGYHTPTPKDSVMKKDSPTNSVKNKSGERESLDVIQGIGSKNESLTRKSDDKDKDKEWYRTHTPKDSVMKKDSPKNSVKNKSGERESPDVIQGIGSKNESLTRKSDDKDKEWYRTPTPKDSVMEKNGSKNSVKSGQRESKKSTVSFGGENKSLVTKGSNNIGSGKREHKSAKKDSILGNRSTGDGTENKGRGTESQRSTVGFASAKKFLTRKSGDEDNGEGKDTEKTNDKDTVKNLVTECKSAGGDIVSKNEEGKSRESTPGFGSEKAVQQSGSSSNNGDINQKPVPNDSAVGNKSRENRNGESESRKSLRGVDRDGKCLTSGSNNKDDESGRNIANEKRCVTIDKLKPGQKDSDCKTNAKKCACDNNKNAGFCSECRTSASNSESEKKDLINNINDAQGKHATASTNDNESQGNAKGGDARTKSYGAQKNGPTGSVNSKSNSGTAQGNFGIKGPTNSEKRNEKTRKTVSTQNKSANNSKSSIKNNPKNSNAKNHSQTTNNQQNVPDGKKSSLENQHDGCHAKEKKTGLKKSCERGPSKDNKANDTNKIRQGNDSRTSSQSDVTQKNPTTSSRAENKNSLNGSRQPSASRNVESGGKTNPKSSLSKEDAARKRYYRFMINARDHKYVSLARNRVRLDESPHRLRSFFPNRKRVSPPGIKGDRMFEASRSPDKAPLRNNSERNSGGVRTRKRAFEATGLVVAPPKRKCLDTKSTESTNAISRDLPQPLMNVDLSNNSKIVPKKIIDCSPWAPPKKMCPDDKSTGRTDKTGSTDKTECPKRVGSAKKLAPKNVIDTTFKATGLVVAPPERRRLNNKRTVLINCKVGTKRVVGSKDLRNVLLKKTSGKRYGKGQKISAGDNSQKGSDGIRRGKVSDANDISTTNEQKDKESSSEEKRSDCFNLDNGKFAGDALKNSDSMKDSSKKLEDKVLAITNTSAKDTTHKNGDGSSIGSTSSLEQNIQKSLDVSSLGEVQVECDSLKHSDSVNDISTPNITGETNCSNQNIFPKGDDENKIKESDHPAKESQILITQENNDMEVYEYGSENQILVKKEHCLTEKFNPGIESKILMKQEQKHPSVSTVSHDQADNSLGNDTSSKIPVSPCSNDLSVNFSKSENSFGMECDHTANTEGNTDTCTTSLTTDITQGNKTNNGGDKLECSSPNTDGLRDRSKKDVDMIVGDRDQMLVENFLQERNPLKEDLGENACHVDQLSGSVAAFSTVITFEASSILTESEQSENEDRNQSESLPVPKVSDKESLKDDRTYGIQEQLGTVSKTVLSKKTSLSNEKTGGLGKSKFILAKLKSLKTNAQKTFKNLSKASVTSSGAKISGNTNSESNGSQKENVSAESLLTNPKSVFENKSMNVENGIVKSAENQSEVAATVSKYFACQTVTIDQQSDVDVTDDKLKPDSMDNSGSSTDCSDSEHKSTDEEQPVIACDSTTQDEDRFPNDNPQSNGSSTTDSKILSGLEGANVSTLTQKSLITQSGRSPVAKHVKQKTSKGENKENRTQKSAVPKVGTNSPDNMQRPVGNKTRLKGIELPIPGALSASNSKRMKESKNSEVFLQENTSNMVSEEHVTEQYKIVCASSETKSSSTCFEILDKSTASTIAPELPVVEDVKKSKNNLQTTENQPLCVTKMEYDNSSEKNFNSLSAIDLWDNTCIADIDMLDVKQETQLRNEPNSANNNLSFQSSASENNRRKELTNSACDTLIAGESGPRESDSLPFSTITRNGSDTERVKTIKLEKTLPPKDNLEGRHSSIADIFGRPNCDPISSDKTTSASETSIETTSTTLLSIEEKLTKDDKRCSIDDKPLKCDFQRTRDNSGSSNNSVSRSNSNSKGSATTSTVSIYCQGTIMSSASSVLKGDMSTNTLKSENKERYPQVADGSIEKNSIPVSWETEFSEMSTSKTKDSNEHLIPEECQAVLKMCDNGSTTEAPEGLDSVETNPIPVLVRSSSKNVYESKERLIQENRQDALRKSQNGICGGTSSRLNSGSSDGISIPVLGEARLGERFSKNTGESNDLLIQGCKLDGLADGLLNADSIERDPIPVLGEPRLIRSSSTDTCESKERLIQGDRQDVLENCQNVVVGGTGGLRNAASIERNPIPVVGEAGLVRNVSTNSCDNEELLTRGDVLNGSVKCESLIESSSESLLDFASIENILIPIENDGQAETKRNSIENDGQDVNNGNLTRDISITGKRKRDDEPAEVAGNKHQKCLGQSQDNSLNDAQNNGSISGIRTDRVEGLSKDGRRRQREERSFIRENVLAIQEQYAKENTALLKNVKMLASMDPSLTEKLKGAFKDSLAEIGRKFVQELYKLKQKNDDYKNKQRLAQASNNGPQNKPQNKRQGTAKGKTQTRQRMDKGKASQNNPKNKQQSTPQSKTASQQKMGEGMTPQNKPKNKQQSTPQGKTPSQQRMSEGMTPQNKPKNKQQSTPQSKTPSQQKMSKARAPQNIPNNQQKKGKGVKGCVHQPMKKTKGVTKGVVGHGQTNNQQMIAGGNMAQNMSQKQTNVQVLMPQTGVSMNQHSPVIPQWNPSNPHHVVNMVQIGPTYNPNMTLHNIPLCW